MIRIVLPLAGAALVACAAALPRALGPVDAFVADEQGGLRRVMALTLPVEAELELRPRWFAGQLTPPGAPAPRLQVILRALRQDGGIVQWALTGDTDGREDGTVGLDSPSPNGRYQYPLTAQRIPALRARDLVALELLVASLPPLAPEARGAPPIAHWRAAAATAQAPPLRCVDLPTLTRAEAAAARAEGRLELAARLPLISQSPEKATDFALLLVLVEADPWPRRPTSLEDRLRLDAVEHLAGPDGVPTYPATTARGLAVAHTSALALEVRVHLPPAGPKPPDGPPREPPPRARPDPFSAHTRLVAYDRVKGQHQ